MGISRLFGIKGRALNKVRANSLYQLLQGVFNPTTATDLVGETTFRQIASESLLDGNSDQVVMPAMEGMMYETLKYIIPYQRVFEGLKFYSIGDEVTRNKVVEQIKAGQLCVGPLDFNDAVDPLYTVFAKILQRGKRGEEQRWYSLLEKLTAHIRISCLCNKADKEGKDNVENLLMWAHYANHHKGICVRYTIPQEFSKKDDSSETVQLLKPIRYEDRQVSIKNINLEDAFFLKSSQWGYEDEYRVLYYSPALTDAKKDGYVPISGVRVKAVYLGAKIKDSNKGYLLKELAGMGIPIYQMKYTEGDVLRLHYDSIK